MERVSRELERRADSPDEGWDERDALKHWTQICGPSAISGYLHTFLINEVRLRSNEELEHWQVQFTRLFNFVLRHAMPMEQLQIATFREEMFQSRNAEEGLLVALNVCARSNKRLSNIEWPDSTTFGTWLKRIGGNMHSSLVRRSLSFLNLREANLFASDLTYARLESSDLDGIVAELVCLVFASLSDASLKNAFLWRAVFLHANLSNADLERARLDASNFDYANLIGALLKGASLEGASLRGASLRGANLTEANLTEANLTEANLTEANLTDADLTDADLTGADLTDADLTAANLTRANLTGANFEGVNLHEANLKDVNADERVAEQISAFRAKELSP
jgi:uncharacterized protein YjbI with pentapeptide repeats